MVDRVHWALDTVILNCYQPSELLSSELLPFVLVIARQRSRWCSQKLRKPFLQAVRFDCLINYITLRGTIFPLLGV